ncbi:hypothetical protein EJB05_38075, partial [Eragrostis curvula]
MPATTASCGAAMPVLLWTVEFGFLACRPYHAPARQRLEEGNNGSSGSIAPTAGSERVETEGMLLGAGMEIVEMKQD